MAFGTILLPYDGSEAADAMLHLACDTVTKAGRVLPLYVTRVPASLPLAPLPPWYDDEGQAALDRAETVAWQRGVQVDSWLVRARHRADAIVAVAHGAAADAIFMPLPVWRYPWRRLKGALTARTVSQKAPCPVLVGTWNAGKNEQGSPRHGTCAAERPATWTDVSEHQAAGTREAGNRSWGSG